MKLVGPNASANNQSTPDVDDNVCNEDKSYSKSTVGNAQDVPLEREEKVLGIRWNYVSDTFIFNFQQIVQAARDLKPTKRQVIGIISRFYDPLGVLAPITIKLKMFFQELCQSKVEWDEELAGDLKKSWNQLITELENLQSTVIPRCYRNLVPRLFPLCEGKTLAGAGHVIDLPQGVRGCLILHLST